MNALQTIWRDQLIREIVLVAIGAILFGWIGAIVMFFALWIYNASQNKKERDRHKCPDCGTEDGEFRAHFCIDKKV